MIRHFSAGGIVFNSSGKVLIIKTPSLSDSNKSYWGFPKGHIEKGESSKYAALREVKEETGIQAQIIEKLGDSSYIFTKDSQRNFKTVTFYKMRAVSDRIAIQTTEIIEARWIDPEEAKKLLSFSKDKEFLDQALKD